MSAVEKKHLTIEEYLALERKSEYKSEYYRGEMFAMTGASRKHGLIAMCVGGDIFSQLENSPCEVFQSDMRVKIEASGMYVYPDVVVACDNPQYEDDALDTLINPQVVIEILSDSTEKYDRGAKFEHYRRLSSLKQYVLITQDRPMVESYIRQEDDQWILWASSDMDAVLQLPAIGCQVPLQRIYRRVTFTEQASQNPSS